MKDILTFDDSWITVKPNGKKNKGSHVKLDDDGRVLAGMGGKFNGVKINEARASFIGPRTPQKNKNDTPGKIFRSMSGRELRQHAMQGVEPGQPDLNKIKKIRENLSDVEKEYETIKTSIQEKQKKADELEKRLRDTEESFHKKHGNRVGNWTKEEQEQLNSITRQMTTAKKEARQAKEENKDFMSSFSMMKQELNAIERQLRQKDLNLPEGQTALRRPIPIRRETDKAVLVERDGESMWMPKSQLTVKNGEVVGGKEWVFKKNGLSMDSLTFDATTARRIDENGYLHVSGNRITKAVVNPYYGHEIPGWEEAGLDPEKVYYGFRAPEELKKAVGTFSGVPLQLDHHPDSADDPQKQARVGTIGTDAAWMDPYVVASLCVWDAAAIDAIESGRMKELSCAYRYDPDFTPGTYDGQRYDFIMRNIRGNHVALVEEGRAGPDVVVADSQTVKECSMYDMMQDGDPAIEQKEVDLAQAIIDLHRVDPMTGQLVDVAEDEDKNAEIRRLMDELTPTMTPEQRQKLHSALSDLAYSKPTGDAEGGNAEFAEGVKYGEKLERDPAERRKLDSEHESEGMRKAMDECGLDADDPASSKAFAEGVKYGEKLIRNPEEREKLDREHEREGMEKKYGMDAATVRREAAVEARKQMKELSDAARKVRPLCGEVDPFAFDSAQDIYRHAIESRGRDASRYQPAAWEGIVDVMLERPMAADSAPVSTKETMLPHLDRFIR